MKHEKDYDRGTDASQGETEPTFQKDFLYEAELVMKTSLFMMTAEVKTTILTQAHTLALMDIARTLRQMHKLLAATAAAGEKREKE